jgi:hypothetical protein
MENDDTPATGVFSVTLPVAFSWRNAYSAPVLA